MEHPECFAMFDWCSDWNRKECAFSKRCEEELARIEEFGRRGGRLIEFEIDE